MPTDKFGQPYFYPNKSGGYNFEQSNNPKNDNAIEGLDSSFSVSGDVITMKPSGPTSFSVGKNARTFTDSIGGCNMDFKATAARGYAYKKDDVRDLEFKCLLQVNGLQSGHDGFSMSACTGRHTSSNCCQGFAYMGSLDGTNSNPTLFRFRKETVHVEYTDSPEGSWSHPKMNFKVDGHGWIGFGFCRYNDPASPDDTVILEIWANPNPDADITNWIMLKRHKDKPGDGWTGSPNKCNGNKDQIGTWSGAYNRLKSNSSGGTIKFKNITFREIDPAGSFDPTPPPLTCPPGQHLSGGVCVPDTNPPINCPAGQHNENGICVPDSSGGGSGGGGGVGSPLSYTFGFKFGSNGTGNGQFQDPHDIGFNAAGDLFITDRIRNDIQKFTPTGTYISKFGGTGSADGQLNVPYSCQVDASGNIYVADRENNRVQKFSSAGVYISKITTVNGQAFNKPEDVTFDRTNGDIYILDTGNDRCVKLNSAHTFILQWGTTGSGNGQFQHPHSINTDSNRDVFISCGNQPYIQKFTSTGTFIKKWGTEGNGPGQTRMFLEHMDIDLHDRVHLVNNDVRPIVNVWDNQGMWLTQYGKTTSGNADGQFKEPEHITTEPSTGKPYVVDAKNQRIQVFNVNEPVAPPPSGPPPPTTTSRVQGSLRLLWDINTVTGVGACSGSGGGGGGGGTAFAFYTELPDGTLGNNALDDHRTGIYETINTDTAAMKGKRPIRIDLWLAKVGSPTGTATVLHRSAPASASYVKETFGTIDVTTLTTTETMYSFGPTAGTQDFNNFNKIGIEYTGGNASNYITVARNKPGGFDGQKSFKVTKEDGVYVEAKDLDLCAVIYEA